MAKLKDIKGTAIQFLDADPVLYAGSWSSGGSLSTARTALQSSGTGTDNAIVGGGYNASSSPSRIKSEQYNGTAWTETSNINNSRMFGSGAGTATAAIISGGDPTGYTETWNGSSWTEVAEMSTARNQQQNIGTVPSALAIGGGVPSATNKVESWNGSAWTESSYDLNTAKKYVTGTGIVTACIVMGQPTTTEQFNGSSWTEIAESNTPHSSGAASGIVTDALFYGGDNPGFKANTETWNGSAWTEVSDMATTTGYLGGTQNSSSGNTNSLAFGGSTPSQTTATEEWAFPPVTASALQEGLMWFNGGLKVYGTAAGIPAATWASGGSMNAAKNAVAGNGVSNSAAMAVGGGGTSATELYNGTSWSEVNELNTGGNYIACFGITTASIAAGGGRPGYSNLVESWNGSNWTEVNELNTARAYFGGAGTQTSGIVIGGEPTGADTQVELWDGTNWTETTEVNTGVRQFARAGHTGNTDALKAGGYTGTAATANTEIWNGSSWTEVNNLNVARYALNGDGATSGQALAFGGNTSGTNTESWNGTSWTEVNNLTAAQTNFGAAGTSISMLMFGGDTPSATANTFEWTADAGVATVTTS